MLDTAFSRTVLPSLPLVRTIPPSPMLPTTRWREPPKRSTTVPNPSDRFREIPTCSDELISIAMSPPDNGVNRLSRAVLFLSRPTVGSDECAVSRAMPPPGGRNAASCRAAGRTRLLQDAVLLSEILDHPVLLAGNPAGEGRNEDLPRLEHGRHPRMLADRPDGGQLSSRDGSE